MFADVPDFDVEFTYEEVYSPDGIANQLLQNFFNWFCPTVFWFSFLPFYERSVTYRPDAHYLKSVRPRPIVTGSW